MDRMILSIFTGGGLCACCKPEMTSSVAMDILQLKSYQDEWDRTQRQMDLAKRDQQSKEQVEQEENLDFLAEYLAQFCDRLPTDLEDLSQKLEEAEGSGSDEEGEEEEPEEDHVVEPQKVISPDEIDTLPMDLDLGVFEVSPNSKKVLQDWKIVEVDGLPFLKRRGDSEEGFEGCRSKPFKTATPTQEAEITNPPKDAETTPPQKAETTPPQEAETTTKDAETTPPQKAETTPPQEAETTTPPQEAETTTLCQEAETTTAPQEAETTTPPQEAETTTPPKQAETTKASKRKKNNQPKDAEKTKRKKGETTAQPQVETMTKEGKIITECGEHETTTPPNNPERVPKKAETTSLPKEAETTTLPKEAKEAARGTAASQGSVAKASTSTTVIEDSDEDETGAFKDATGKPLVPTEVYMSKSHEQRCEKIMGELGPVDNEDLVQAQRKMRRTLKEAEEEDDPDKALLAAEEESEMEEERKRRKGKGKGRGRGRGKGKKRSAADAKQDQEEERAPKTPEVAFEPEYPDNQEVLSPDAKPKDPETEPTEDTGNVAEAANDATGQPEKQEPLPRSKRPRKNPTGSGKKRKPDDAETSPFKKAKAACARMIEQQKAAGSEEPSLTAKTPKQKKQKEKTAKEKKQEAKNVSPEEKLKALEASLVAAFKTVQEVANSDSLFVLPDEIQQVLKDIDGKKTITFVRKICS
eukprot:s757_g19.t1